MRSQSPISPGLAAGALAFAALAWSWPLAMPAPLAAAEEEQAKEIIAVQIRKQGYACQRPQSAERDPEASQPDRAAWVEVVAARGSQAGRPAAPSPRAERTVAPVCRRR